MIININTNLIIMTIQIYNKYIIYTSLAMIYGATMLFHFAINFLSQSLLIFLLTLSTKYILLLPLDIFNAF